MTVHIGDVYFDSIARAKRPNCSARTPSTAVATSLSIVALRPTMKPSAVDFTSSAWATVAIEPVSRNMINERILFAGHPCTQLCRVIGAVDGAA